MPSSILDPDAQAGAASLRTRYHTHSETRNTSTDEQLDGESFRLSGWSSGPSGPTQNLPLTDAPEGHLDSDALVDMVVRRASARQPEAVSEPTTTDSSQTLGQNGPTTIQALVNGQGRVRSKTISSIPQSPGSFVKLAQDKLPPLESDSSSTITVRAPPTTAGSHHDITILAPEPSSLETNRQPLHHPSTSQSSPDYTPEALATRRAPSPPGRVKSAPVRPEEPSEQAIRPNPGRTQSDTVVRSSPTKAKLDKANDVRKRIEELEAKMRGDAK